MITASLVKELRTITGAAMMDCKHALDEANGSLEKAQEILRKKGQLIATKKSARETLEGAIFIKTEGQKASLIKLACETDFVARNQKFQDFLLTLSQTVLQNGAENLLENKNDQGKLQEQLVALVAELGENISLQEVVNWDLPPNAVCGFYVHTNAKIGTLVELAFEPKVDAVMAAEIATDLAMHIAASTVEAVAEQDLDPKIIEKEKEFLITQAQESNKPQEIIEKMIQGRLRKFTQSICLLNQLNVQNPEQSIIQFLEQAGKKIGTKFSVIRFHKSQI